VRDPGREDVHVAAPRPPVGAEVDADDSPAEPLPEVRPPLRHVRVAPPEDDAVGGGVRLEIRIHVRAPGRYYVNVHTMQYPGGAARGQLHA
jgi:hypothetical protein